VENNPLSYSITPTVNVAQAKTYTLTCNATNAAGTSLSASQTYTVSPVQINLTISLSENPVLLNATNVTASATATDGNGVSVGTPTCDAVNTATIGPNSVTCRVTDQYGNTASDTLNYNVQYVFGGFQAPITPLVVRQINSTIPVKYQLLDANGASVIATHPNELTFTISNNLGACGSFTGQALPNPHFIPQLFRLTDNNTYILNFQTKGLTAGQYRLFANLDDGTTQTVDICLKK
jgi:hypothetical protein